MSVTAERPCENTWRVVEQGTLFKTKLYPSGLPAGRTPYAQYYEVARPGSDKVVAEVEFADREGTDYTEWGTQYLVDLTVRARGEDDEFSSTITGEVRTSFISDEEFILEAAKLAAELAAHNGSARHATDLEALMN